MGGGSGDETSGIVDYKARMIVMMAYPQGKIYPVRPSAWNTMYTLVHVLGGRCNSRVGLYLVVATGIPRGGAYT